jgi:hypothetical protein
MGQAMKTLHSCLGISALWLGLIAPAFGGSPPPDQKGPHEIGRTTEREVNIVLSSGFGTIRISKGEPEKILVLSSPAKNDETPGASLDYAIRNRVGYAEISLGEEPREETDHEKKWLQFGSLRGNAWDLRVSDAIPVAFDLELGVGKADIDLTGLQVKDLTLSAGASDVEVSFDQQNTVTIENMNIESGVSKFTGRNLGNANFRKFRFEGGVGSYTLDFSGKLQTECDVDVEIGLGTLTIVVPKQLGAKIIYEKSWLSHLDCGSDFKAAGEDQYVSNNYPTATGRMNIRIQSGLGNVKIRR